MSKKVLEEIKNHIDENGKLTCTDAFKVSAKTKTDIREVGKVAHDNDIRIISCELGQFGKLDKSEFSDELKERINKAKDDKNRLTCKEARELSAGVGLKKMRGTLHKEKVDIINCELGCFTEKKRPRMKIKTKIWIENNEGQLLFGKGKTEILEAIAKEKSISAASEILNMNYKKAWTHVQILQKYIDDILVYTQKGRGEQGGSFLTPKGEEYIEKYRELESDIEEYANARFRELFLKPRNKKD